MQFKLLSLVLLLQVASASPIEETKQEVARAAEDSCSHNNDAGRWDDDMKPSDRLDYLCYHNGGCWDARIGRMCVNGDLSNCLAAGTAARQWESWHGNWFLWSAITCGGISVTITSK